ncbi:hypothetical protein ACJ72_00953 [Emergomyces africanus]|uniref:Zn(2)-C6 fungal-type domain-containing protein n=1 Tax=Emergomyces africanus TaxID=1955775 RepID=A0A1B7P6M8_9EURO|nr:hypothetical protein ACJ72_00953 [Emergomyces africanus]
MQQHIDEQMHDNYLLAYSNDDTPRKRRRPALACDQCRRRKIKCDQKVPCDQCRRSKNLSIDSCTYAHAHTPAGSASSNTTTATTPATSTVKRYARTKPQHFSVPQVPQVPQAPQGPPGPTVPISLVNHPGSFTAYPSPTTAILSDQSPHADDQRSDTTRSTRNVTQNLQSPATIQALVDRPTVGSIERCRKFVRPSKRDLLEVEIFREESLDELC